MVLAVEFVKDAFLCYGPQCNHSFRVDVLLRDVPTVVCCCSKTERLKRFGLCRILRVSVSTFSHELRTGSARKSLA